MDRIEEFERLAADLKARIGRQANPRLMRLYFHLAARRELKEEDSPEAFRLLSKVTDLMPVQVAAMADEDQAAYLYTLAEADEQEMFGLRAPGSYEKVTVLTWGRAFRGDIYARSFYKIAECRQLGRGHGSSGSGRPNRSKSSGQEPSRTMGSSSTSGAMPTRNFLRWRTPRSRLKALLTE